jgi:hypothetical protein
VRLCANAGAPPLEAALVAGMRLANEAVRDSGPPSPQPTLSSSNSGACSVSSGDGEVSKRRRDVGAGSSSSVPDVSDGVMMRACEEEEDATVRSGSGKARCGRSER